MSRIKIDLTKYYKLINKKAQKKYAILDIGPKDGEEVKRLMELFNQRYGTIPKKLYELPMDNVVDFLRRIISKYEKDGINTLSEIEEAIKNRKPYRGPTSYAMLKDGVYKIYVDETLLFDSSLDYFDCEWKRFQRYLEIQHMIANHIYKKPLNQIRKEFKKNT